jgi:hypothetical protein
MPAESPLPGGSPVPRFRRRAAYTGRWSATYVVRATPVTAQFAIPGPCGLQVALGPVRFDFAIGPMRFRVDRPVVIHVAVGGQAAHPTQRNAHSTRRIHTGGRDAHAPRCGRVTHASRFRCGRDADAPQTRPGSPFPVPSDIPPPANPEPSAASQPFSSAVLPAAPRN